jgi:hypothetical protein
MGESYTLSSSPVFSGDDGWQPQASSNSLSCYNKCHSYMEVGGWLCLLQQVVYPLVLSFLDFKMARENQ